ncbi:MAG: DUF488 domain-containing protein [Hyphomicrobiales bacterium]|nr:DUF488 domain-containing protein [Hyphomicrobiales bacterium]
MAPSNNYDILTIGHSNLAADAFVGLLRRAGVDAVGDVRSVPFSRWCPWFSAKPLAERLARERIDYFPLGDTLGGRPREPALYRDGVADYETMARWPAFSAGLDRAIDLTRRHRLCLMCAERSPLDCHRSLLLAPALTARGVSVGHILADGTIAAHAAIEQQLLAQTQSDLFADPATRVAAAYRRRSRSIAAKKPPKP